MDENTRIILLLLFVAAMTGYVYAGKGLEYKSIPGYHEFMGSGARQKPGGEKNELSPSKGRRIRRVDPTNSEQQALEHQKWTIQTPPSM